jgi:hypothetical protein
LIKPSLHRDTVTFFQLLAEYRPLALINSPIAAVASLADSSYLSLAIKVAKEIGLDQSWVDLGIPESGGNSLLETLQWLHLYLTRRYSSFVMGKSDLHEDWLADVRPMVKRVDQLVKEQAIPFEALALTLNLLLAARSATARHRMILDWRDLNKLRIILRDHDSECSELRAPFLEMAKQRVPQEHEHAGGSTVFTTLMNAELHKHHLLVKQSAIFFAVMAARYLRDQAEFKPTEITQGGDHIIDRLKIPLELDQIHAFMAEFGSTTADELEEQLTGFIHLCDLRLNNIHYAPPTKTFASEVLHTAYLLVQQNAARLKGWGGFHDRIDVHIDVLRDSASKLVELAGQEADGEKICGPTASLVRDLGSILREWKTRSVQMTAAVHPETSSFDRLSTSSRGLPSAPSTEQQNTLVRDNDTGPSRPSGAWAADMFATWDMWPQPEDIDFSQFTDFDYDPNQDTA